MDDKILYSIIVGMTGMVGYFWVKDRNSIDKDIAELVDIIKDFTEEIKQSNEDYKEAYKMCMEEIEHLHKRQEKTDKRIEKLFELHKDSKDRIKKIEGK